MLDYIIVFEYHKAYVITLYWREGGRERERVYSVTKGGRGVLITIHDSSSILFKD